MRAEGRQRPDYSVASHGQLRYRPLLFAGKQAIAMCQQGYNAINGMLSHLEC